MSLVDLFAGLVLGLGAGLVLLFSPKFYKRKPAPSSPTLTSTAARSVPAVQLERAKQEYRTIMLEREALAAAITRFYEAEAAGEITAEERVSLVKKYEEELKALDSKLSNLELLIEVGEMERLREEVVKLIQEKFRQIESRVTEARMKLGLTVVPGIRETPAAEPAKVAPEAKGLTKRRVESKGEERSRKLREEILSALARLEQIDVEEG